MITVVLFALVGGIGGLYFGFPMLEEVWSKPLRLFSYTLLFSPLPFAFICGVLGYILARLIGWRCQKFMTEVGETTILEPFVIASHTYYLLKTLGHERVSYFFFTAPFTKLVVGKLSDDGSVEVKAEDRRSGAFLKTLKPVFVRPNMRRWACLGDQKRRIISVPKGTVFDGTE